MKKMGFGLMRLPQTDKDKPETINQEQVNKMTELFLEKGYTYFDTAYPYHNGKSEIALKEALKNHHRESYIVADKLPIFAITKEEEVEPIFKEQLERCGVEYFDYYLLHNISPFSEAGYIDVDSYKFLKQQKDAGKIKKLGFSSHGDANYIEKYLQKYPDMDFIQLQINYLDWESQTIESKKCYEVAKKHDLEVIVMEPLKGGFLANIPEDANDLIKKFNPTLTPVELALRFVANLDNVFMVLCGVSSYKQMEENIEIFENMQPLSKEELDLIKQVSELINSKITVPCTKCNYCINECPVNINIPYVFDLYNSEKLLNEDGFTTYQVTYINYMKNKKNGPASACIDCGKCVEKCPQQINIPQVMKDVVESLENKPM